MEEKVPSGGPALGLASSQSESVACPSRFRWEPALVAALITHPRHPAQLAPAWARLVYSCCTTGSGAAVQGWAGPRRAMVQVPWSCSWGRALASVLLQRGVALEGERSLWFLSTVPCLAAMTRRQSGGGFLWSQGSPAEFSPSGCKRNGRGVSHCMRREQEDILLMPSHFQFSYENLHPPTQEKGKISIQRASPPAQWDLAPGSGPCEGWPWTQLGLVLRKLAMSWSALSVVGSENPLPKKLSVWGFIWCFIFVLFWFKYVPLFLFTLWLFRIFFCVLNAQRQAPF